MINTLIKVYFIKYIKYINMYSDFFQNIYLFFLQIYDSMTADKNKKPTHKYDECVDDEEILYLNQTDDELIYLEQTIKREK